jgi:hypothetical protein
VADVYDIMMRIGVTDAATSVFRGLAEILGGIERQLANVSGAFQRVGADLGAIGLGLGAIGVSGLAGLNALTNAAAPLTEQFTRMRAAGMSAVEMMQAMKVAQEAWSRVPGSDLSQNLKAVIDLAGRMGGVANVAPVFSQLVAAGRTLEQLRAGGMGDVTNLVQALGPRGLTAPGAQDELMRYIQGMVRAVQASGGAVTAQQYMRTMRMGGAGAMGVSEDFFNNVLPFLMLNMPGGGGMGGAMANVGTILQQDWAKTVQAIQGGRGSKEWQALGIEPTQQMLANPQVLSQAIGEALARRGVTDRTAILAEFQALFGGRAGGAMAELFLNREQLEQFRGRAGRAPGATIAGVAGAAEQDPEQISQVLRTTIQGVVQTLGEAEAQIKADWEKSLLPWAQSVREWVVGMDPEKLKMVMQVITALAAGLAVLGATALVAGVAMMVGPTGLLVALAAALTALAAVDFGGIVSKLDEFEGRLQGWGQRFRNWLGSFAPTDTDGASDKSKAIESLSKLPGFQTGISQVPDDMLALLHKDEMVVQSETAGKLRDFLDSVSQLVGTLPEGAVQLASLGGGGGDLGITPGTMGAPRLGGGLGGAGAQAPAIAPAEVQAALAGLGMAKGGIDRSMWAGQLTPSVVTRMAQMIQGEVGLGPGRSVEKQIIELETLFNRATARQYGNIAQDLYHGSGGYYASGSFPQVSSAQTKWFTENVLKPVMAGSDLGTAFLGVPPTGNASQMGFAGRRLAEGIYARGRWWGDHPGRDEMFVLERHDVAGIRDHLSRIHQDNHPAHTHARWRQTLQHMSGMPPHDEQAVHVQTALNIDGRELTRHVSRHQIRMAEFSRTAPSPDGRRLFTVPDHNYS